MSSTLPPDGSVLTALEDLVEAWSAEDFAGVRTTCNSLLKKRKALGTSLGDAVQRVLLQSYLQEQAYDKVLDWASTNAAKNGGSNHHADLVLYAQYRLGNYGQVSKQAASKSTSLECHLLAQSHFHLNQVQPALKVYQDLLAEPEVDEGSRMELFTNALAVLSSSDAIPYVPMEAESSGGRVASQAQSFLEEYPKYSDLALNLGTLQLLGSSESLTGESEDFLELAREHCQDDSDLPPISINSAWGLHFWQQNEEGDVEYPENEGTATQSAIAKLNRCLLEQKPLPTQPHPKWNALQVRMYWYNRAVQQFRSNQLVECQESCQSLRKVLANSSSVSNSGGAKKKKGGDVQPSSPTEWWWQSRIDVLLAHVQARQQSKSSSSSLSSAASPLSKLQQRLEGLQAQVGSSDIIDHAMAYVQLHLHSLQNTNPTKEQNYSLLQSLPESIQAKRAVTSTTEVISKGLAASTNLKSKNGKGTRPRSPTDEAELLFAQGRYAEAAKSYETNLPEPVECDGDQLQFQLKRVQALAMSDQHDASVQLWEILTPLLDPSAMEDPSSKSSGEILEEKALPRSNKAAQLAGANLEDEDKNTKRSKESVLRQRARQREAYLKKLEERGDYNPDRPTKPNAERWIPKHERSRARRRGQNSRSAQGGGSQVDAQRLDAAARRAGKIPASAGPSTANMKVSSTGGSRKGGRRR